MSLCGRKVVHSFIPVRGARAGDAAFEFLEAAGEAEIARLERHGLGEHVAGDFKCAVADVAVGPMVKKVYPLHR